jgi:hypothetical protein
MVRTGHVLALVSLVLATTGALLATAPAPASAAAKVVSDRSGDTAHPADILRVRVQHEDRIVVVVTHRNLTFRDGPAQVRVAYDTGSRYAGPEFYLRVRFQTDQKPELRPAQGWDHLSSAPVATCTGELVRVRPDVDRTRVSVPRSCFGTPHRIRVHVRMTPFAGDDRSADVAPAARTMGPWVTH